MTQLTAAAAITPLRLSQFATHSDAKAVAPGLDAACAQFGIDTPTRVSDFLGETFVESAGFTRLVENLNYTTAQRIVEVFGARVPTIQDANPLVCNPEALASRVYGGRFGNSAPDDGWRYRARGWIGVTFKDNYAALSKIAGVDLVADPDRLASPDVASLCAAAWWAHRNLNPLADLGQIDQISREINGGANGLTDRRDAIARARTIWRG